MEYGFKKYVADRGRSGEIICAYINNPELKIHDLCFEFKKSISEIYRILKKHEISPNRLKLNHEKVKHLSNLGYATKQISEFTGYTPRNIRYILKNLGQQKNGT